LFRANQIFHFIKITTKNGPQINLDVSNANITIFEARHKIPWKLHIEQVIHMLNAARYALRSIETYMFQEVIKIVYYAYFHSTMSRGIIFWGNSADSTKIIEVQNRPIRNITRSKNRDSCRDLFKILPFHSQYILSFLLSVVDNKACTKNLTTMT
jgi:hypothetical protein